jgi:hypothetical protein
MDFGARGILNDSDLLGALNIDFIPNLMIFTNVFEFGAKP